MKTTKRIVAAALSCLVAATSMFSCSLSKKLSFADMLKETSNIKNYSAQMVLNETFDKNSIDLNLDLQQSNNNVEINKLNIKTNFSAPEVDSDAEEYDIDIPAPENVDMNLTDAVKMVDGEFYLNVASIIDSVQKIAGNEVNIDKDMLGTEWLLINNFNDKDTTNKVIKSANELSQTFTNTFVDILNSSDTKIEEDGDNGYKVTIKDKDNLQKVLDASYDKLKEQKDTYTSKLQPIFDSYNLDNIKANVSSFAGDIVKALCDKLEIKYTDEDLNGIKDMINEGFSAVDTEELESMNTSDVGNMYDEFMKALEEAKDSLKDSDSEVTAEYKISLEGKEGSRVCKEKITFSAKAKSGEDEEKVDLNIELTATENDKTVKAPENAKTLTDVVPKVIDYLKNNGMINQATLDAMKGQNLSDLMNAMQQQMAAMSDPTLMDYSEYENDVA